jgi:hypothetical protein
MQLPANQRRGWLRAHRKLVLVLWLGLAVSGALMGFALMRSSDAVKLAIATAKSNPALVERLGQPLKTGWFVAGSIEITPASGHAELAIPVSGPKGRGTIYAEARKRAGALALEHASVWRRRKRYKTRPVGGRSNARSDLSPSMIPAILTKQTRVYCSVCCKHEKLSPLREFFCLGPKSSFS